METSEDLFNTEKQLKTKTKKMTGSELITKERQEQIEKHGRTVELDVENNKDEQLIDAVFGLLAEFPDEIKNELEPDGWDNEIWKKMVNKPYKERLVICGALIAAEIDRISYEKVTE